MSKLTFDQIAGANTLDTVEFTVAEWGGSIVLRSLTKLENDEIVEACMEQTGIGRRELNTRKYEMLVFCQGMVDPSISPAQYEHLSEVAAAGVISKVLSKIFELSRIGKDDLKEIGRNFPIGSGD